MPKLAVVYSVERDAADAPRADAADEPPPASPVPVSPDILASRADNAVVAHAVARVLASVGHDVTVHAVWDRVPVAALQDVDAVMNLCEGLGGQSAREAEAAQQLEDAGIPYSGNRPETLALCQKKERCRARLVEAGVPVPAAVVLTTVPDLWPAALPSPAIVKPAWEDASEGIDHKAVVHDLAGLQAAVARVVNGMGEPALCEAYIEGRELTVSLLGTPVTPLPLGEIDFTRVRADRPKIVCYAAKWCPGSEEFETTPSVTCRLDAATTARAKKIARDAARALGLSDIARIDLRLDKRGGLYVIDVNPNCDLGEDAGFAKAGYRAGMTYVELLHRVLERALATSRQRRRAVAVG